LTPLGGARNSSETLDFIEPAEQAQPAPESASRHFAYFFCPIRGIKSKNFVRRCIGRVRVDVQFVDVQFRRPGLKIGFEPEV